MKVFFDRPTKKELMNVLHHFFLNEIDYENLQEINIFKLRIALNIFKILKREIMYEKELIKDLGLTYDLRRKYPDLCIFLLKMN